MAKPLAVLLLDDGELDDVQEILEKTGAAFGRVRGGAIAPNTPPPTTLLVSTPRRIESVREVSDRGPEGGEGPVRIVVVEGDSTTLRAKLREIGFDYLVRRPVHPEALRLLLLHCLYTGEERRREPRVPVGLEVSFRSGLLPRRATLAELSGSGCRLLSTYRLESGKPVRIQIPKAPGANEALSLAGRVIRCGFEERLGENGLHCAAVIFEDVSNEVRQELDWILQERARGPATLRGTAEDPDETHAEPAGREAAPSTQTEAPPERPEAAQAPPSAEEIQVDVRLRPEGRQPTAAGASAGEGGARADRRGGPRGAYPRKVPAFGSQALRVLVGRDLSAGGMRVERFPELEIGDRLHLAIYGDAHEEPLLVWATVARDDGEAGIALTFDPPHPVVCEQLEKVVASLPAVESLHDDEVRAMGTVVTRILES